MPWSGFVALCFALSLTGCLSGGLGQDVSRLEDEMAALQADLAAVRGQYEASVNQSLARDRTLIHLVDAIADLQAGQSDIVDHFLAELRNFDASRADQADLDLAAFVGTAARPSVVKVLAELDGGTTVTGSGWAWSDGYVVTASHAVAAGRLRVVTFDGGSLGADVAAVSTDQDLALLRVPGLAISALVPGTDPHPGDILVGIGHPQGYTPWSVSLGHASSSSGGAKPRVSSDMPIGPGSSGGPILGADGRVAGMTIGGQWPAASDQTPPGSGPLHVHDEPLTAAAEAAVHVPIGTIAALVDGWLASGSPPSPS